MAIKKVIDSTLQAVRNMPKKIFSFFDIHMRLYYRCVKIWIEKTWEIFGQSSISPNFHGAKVSLHTVFRNTDFNYLKY